MGPGSQHPWVPTCPQIGLETQGRHPKGEAPGRNVLGTVQLRVSLCQFREFLGSKLRSLPTQSSKVRDCCGWSVPVSVHRVMACPCSVSARSSSPLCPRSRVRLGLEATSSHGIPQSPPAPRPPTVVPTAGTTRAGFSHPFFFPFIIFRDEKLCDSLSGAGAVPGLRTRSRVGVCVPAWGPS